MSESLYKKLAGLQLATLLKKDFSRGAFLWVFDFFRTAFSQNTLGDCFWTNLEFSGQYRSSHPEVFCKKCVLNNFAKYTGKHLCQSPATLLKKRLAQAFPVNFAKFLRTPFFIEHLWWLLLCGVLVTEIYLSVAAHPSQFLESKMTGRKF